MAKSRSLSTLSPLAAVTRGAAAGAVGTAAMDVLWFLRYKRGGGEDGFLAWETGATVAKWDDASAPGQLGKRIVEGRLAA